MGNNDGSFVREDAQYITSEEVVSVSLYFQLKVAHYPGEHGVGGRNLALSRRKTYQFPSVPYAEIVFARVRARGAVTRIQLSPTTTFIPSPGVRFIPSLNF
jgi:hypothetical protein